MNDLTNRPGFRAGIAEYPRDNDPLFESAQDAETHAIARSLDHGVWAVWAGETGETLSLVFEGTVFTP